MLQKPEACKGCPLEKEGEGFAMGDGPTDSKLYIVGEALGKNEAEEGKPFVGGSGKVLNAMLYEAEIRRGEVYVTNSCKCRPPNNRVPDDDEIAFCVDKYLSKELANKPNCILALGQTAMKATLPRTLGVELYRGSIFNTKFGKVVGTYHPAYVMRQVDRWPTAVADIRRAIDESKSSEYIAPIENFNLNPTLEDVRKMVDRILHTREPFSFDIETTRSHPEEANLLCISICPQVGEVLCIPFLNQGGSVYWIEPEEEEEAWALLWQLMESSVPKIAQNGMVFDIPFLETLGMPVNGEVHDTLIKHHTIYAELPHKLEYLTSIYSRTPYYKSDVKGTGAFLALPNETLRKYNCRDSSVDYEISLALEAELVESGVKEFYDKMVVPLAVEVKKMQSVGMMVDVGTMTSMRDEADGLLDKMEDDFKYALGYNLNLRSPTQIAKVLYGDLGMPIKDRTFGGAPSTNELALRRTALDLGEEDSVLLREILGYRKLDKLRGTYLTLKPWSDGRVRSQMRVYGTTTGRLSSSSPDLQNIPRKPTGNVNIKNLYVASPGYLFIEADYSQIEYRLLAYASNCEKLIRIFESGEDVHAYNTREILDIPITEVLKKDDERRVAIKTLKYADSYGAAPPRICDQLLQDIGVVLPIDKAKNYMAKLRSIYPEEYNHREVWFNEAKEKRFLVNPFGRLRLFFGPESAIRGEAYNYIIQSTAADIINSTFIQLSRSLGELGRIVLQVHDSIMVEAKEERIEETILLMKTCMERPFNLFDREIKIPTGVVVGKRWGTLAPYKGVS